MSVSSAFPRNTAERGCAALGFISANNCDIPKFPVPSISLLDIYPIGNNHINNFAKQKAMP